MPQADHVGKRLVLVRRVLVRKLAGSGREKVRMVEKVRTKAKERVRREQKVPMEKERKARCLFEMCELETGLKARQELRTGERPGETSGGDVRKRGSTLGRENGPRPQ